MEPRIQYAQAADGVNIAFWTLGTGRPLVYLTGGPWNHIDLWQVPECRAWYRRLAQHRTLVRYDMRGTGASERNVDDYSLDAQMLDVEAVADRLSLTDFDLFAATDGGPVAIAYAVAHPERVARLVLWCAWARTADVSSPRIQAWLGLIDKDWELMTDTCAHMVIGWSEGEIGQQAAEALRQNVTPDVAKLALAAMGRFNVEALLPKVQASTLVLQRRDVPWLPADIAPSLASRVRNAHLTFLDGESTAPYLGDTEAAASAVVEFLEQEPASQEGPAQTALAGSSEPRRRPRNVNPDGLTNRELEVLKLVAGGKRNNEIAEELVLSVRTVERHIGNIYGKIGARGRADAAAYTLTHSLF